MCESTTTTTAQGFSSRLARRRSSFPPPSPNLVLTHPIERATARLRVLLRPTRLSAALHTASSVPPPPEGHRIEALEFRRGAAPGEHHSQPTKPLPRLNRPAESQRLNHVLEGEGTSTVGKGSCRVEPCSA